MIVLITNNYPYSGSETFLHNEVVELSKLSDDLVIYPLTAVSGSELAFRVPDNVTVVTPDMLGNRNNKAKALIKSLTDRSFLNESGEIIRNGFSAAKLAANLAYTVKTENYYSAIAEDVRRRTAGKKFVIYSYWMHFHACVALKIKQENPEAFFVTRAHGFDVYENRTSAGYLPRRKEILSKADLIAPVSKAGERYLKNNYKKYKNIDTSKIKTFHLGTYDHGRNPDDRNEVRLISSASMLPVKRIDILIKALSKITDRSIIWEHYGDGPLNESLREEASELGDNIHAVFKGYLRNEDIMDEYSRYHATYFINTSESEGLPVSIMEAMSFGIPVIATDVGGTGEIVRHGSNGFLVDKDITPDDLAEVIEKAIDLPQDEYSLLRKSARETWEADFDAKRNYKVFYSAITGTEQ